MWTKVLCFKGIVNTERTDRLEDDWGLAKERLVNDAPAGHSRRSWVKIQPENNCNGF